jgi:signal transduction histidine kinase
VPAFLAAVLLFGYTTNFLWGLALYPVAVANAVFVVGFRRGIAFAVTTLPLAWAAVYAFDPGSMGILGATFMTALVVPMAIFMVGICKVVIDAERSRDVAQALLRDLEVANAELTRQAERVKALAIAEERARVAREVHDSLGHHLTAINLQLQNAERFAPRDPERSRQKVREARESTLTALTEVRRSVQALKPPALDEQSGIAALSALARSFDGAGPKVSFRLEGEERPLPPEVELALYRATQEGLTNAARHANARNVDVRLAFESEATRLTIADDGEGSTEEALEGGFGLSALRERVEALGGTTMVGNRPEGGFTLEAVVPIDAAESERG